MGASSSVRVAAVAALISLVKVRGVNLELELPSGGGNAPSGPVGRPRPLRRLRGPSARPGRSHAPRRPRPLPRAPEQSPSSVEACRGLRSAPQAATPEGEDVPLSSRRPAVVEAVIRPLDPSVSPHPTAADPRLPVPRAQQGAACISIFMGCCSSVDAAVALDRLATAQTVCQQPHSLAFSPQTLRTFAPCYPAGACCRCKARDGARCAV